jgi:hypothetical protein
MEVLLFMVVLVPDVTVVPLVYVLLVPVEWE